MASGKRGADIPKARSHRPALGSGHGYDFHTVLWLIAVLSANLGLVNLFPVPLLDGGHLVCYAAAFSADAPWRNAFRSTASSSASRAPLYPDGVYTFVNDLSKLL